MSYPGLVGHTDHAQASGKQFFNEIIFFVVERSAAEMANGSGVIDSRSIDLPNECAFARFPDAFGHRVHRAIKRHFSPFLGARRAVLHFCFAPGMREQLIGCGAFRTKISLTDRRLLITFDRNQFPVLVINQLPAADATIWANGASNLRVVGPRSHRPRSIRHRLETGAVLSLANLPNKRPFRKERNHQEVIAKIERGCKQSEMPATGLFKVFERGARLTRKFETSEPRRAWVDIFGEREHLESSSEHFGM
jgi:hypothetical protein